MNFDIRSHVLLVLLIKYSYLQETFNETTSENITNTRRIMGGTPVTEPYPFMVSVQIKGKQKFLHYCGGTLITPIWVLTAAHCLSQNVFTGFRGKLHRAELFRFLIGILELDMKNPDYFYCKSVHIHPHFVPKITMYDVGMMQLTRACNKTLVTIASTSFINQFLHKSNPTCTIMGWGLTDEKIYPNHLLQTKIRIYPMSKCQKFWKGVNLGEDTTICSFNEGEHKDVCFADSGGPLLCNNFQFGIVSFGYDACSYGRPIKPSVHIRPDYLKAWIDSVIAASNKLMPRFYSILLIAVFLQINDGI